MHLGGEPGVRARALYDYSADKGERATKSNTIKTTKSHCWTCHCGELSIRHQRCFHLSSTMITPPRPSSGSLFVCDCVSSIRPWSDALLIFLYEQLLVLMKLGPMRRASSGRDRPHSSWFDWRADTGALRWQRLSRWVAAAFLFALSTPHL